MPTIQVSEAVKAMIDRRVVEGGAENEADFVEAAVRLYAEEFDHDTDELIAEAKSGITDIEAGRYVTISNQSDKDALRDRLRARAKVLLDQMRASDSTGIAASRAPTHAAE